MITHELMSQMLSAMCECETNIKCIPCRIKERTDHLEAQVDRLPDMQSRLNSYYKQNVAMRITHKLHLDALNNYYHALHKCPCRTEENGKCESPWLNIVRSRGEI